MGATSAKALRGAEMDDVIFSGSDKRPSRNWAEVALSINNSQGLAPQPFTDQPTLDVTRRIHRGEGSTYRINGKEVRAKDVQLLFADASTGANSPALVRQGQISELIGAKPQNRRRVLEEAAGVSGLHTRRHEAELRLSAAETNLARLDDIAQELEQAFGRLKREARHAEKYKKLSNDIRQLQRAILYARYQDVQTQRQLQHQAVEDLARQVEETAKSLAAAQVAFEEVDNSLTPLREEEAVATAVRNKVMIEKERLDHEEGQAKTDLARLQADLSRYQSELEREKSVSTDGALQKERLGSAIERVKAEIAAAPSKEPQLLAAVEEAESKRQQTEQAVEQLAMQQARLIERQKSEKMRMTEALSRLERVTHQLIEAQKDQSQLGDFDHAALDAADTATKAAQSRLEAARDDLNRAERDRAEALEAESKARNHWRQAEDAQSQRLAEHKGLQQILSGNRTAQNPVMDRLKPQKGYEAALAAALGDDLGLGLAARNNKDALAFWVDEASGGLDFAFNDARITPLLAFLGDVPDPLKRRLMAVGLVAQADGDSLQSNLPTGARLVSLEGDLWRWDGVIVRARAPKPAAVRLSQRNRLNELEQAIEAQKPAIVAAQTALDEARQTQQSHEKRLLNLRQAIPALESEARRTQKTLDDLRRQEAQYGVRIEGLMQRLERLEADRRDADIQLKTAQATQGESVAPESLLETMQEARALAEQARQSALNARSALEAEKRDRLSREGRLRTLERELGDWVRRFAESDQRVSRFATDIQTTQSALASIKEKLPTFESLRQDSLDQTALAEKRVSEIKSKLDHALSQRKTCEIAVKQEDAKASEARESRASAQARLEALSVRLEELATDIIEQTELEPDALGLALKAEPMAMPSDTAGAESLLSGLMRERDQMGAVNLRAEEEAHDYESRLDSLGRERNDLLTAIGKLKVAINELNAEGRERLLKAFETINAYFKDLFVALFGGGTAELRLVESDDPLEAGLEIFACPPGKKLTSMSLMSGGEQALTATALIFGVFLANPAPVCVLDEVDAPLDDANVDRYCRLLNEMRRRTQTRFIVITHNPVTMSRMDRLFGVTMFERGVSQLVSVDLQQAEQLVAEEV